MITGFSGAGKSQAMACFEDAGYFCVDNLPPEMIAGLAELFEHEGSKVERAAVVSDVRGGQLFDGLVQGARGARVAGDAPPAALPRGLRGRAGQPLQGDAPAPSAGRQRGGGRRADLARDRRRAGAARAAAGPGDGVDRHHRPQRRAAAQGGGGQDAARAGSIGKLAVTFLTYGFKHGAPRDADLLFDVRFLPNPHYEEELRPLTGLDEPVREYVESSDGIESFYAHLEPLLDYLLPQYEQEGKAHLTVGIGCTGGRHRSVVIAEHLAAGYAERGDYLVDVVHRDIDKLPRTA